MNPDDLKGLAADAVAADAVRLDQGEHGAAPGGEGAAAPQLTAAQEWAQVPAVFGRILSRFYPELDPVYSEKACADWGEAMVPVAEKYGWTASKFFAWLGPWIGLGMASEAMVTPTYQALAARVKAAREQKAQGAPPAADA